MTHATEQTITLTFLTVNNITKYLSTRFPKRDKKNVLARAVSKILLDLESGFINNKRILHSKKTRLLYGNNLSNWMSVHMADIKIIKRIISKIMPPYLDGKVNEFLGYDFTPLAITNLASKRYPKTIDNQTLYDKNYRLACNLICQLRKQFRLNEKLKIASYKFDNLEYL